jgi:hypothetical protein
MTRSNRVLPHLLQSDPIGIDFAKSNSPLMGYSAIGALTVRDGIAAENEQQRAIATDGEVGEMRAILVALLLTLFITPNATAQTKITPSEAAAPSTSVGFDIGSIRGVVIRRSW